MRKIALDLKNSFGFISQEDVNSYEVAVNGAMKMLHEGTG